MMESGIGGQIRGVSLDSFLQMAHMEKTTCTLKVIAGRKVGHLYILKGNLISAETGDLEDLDAAHRIIAWENIAIEIDNACSRTEDRINQPLMNILMEGLRLKDEMKAQGLLEEDDEPEMEIEMVEEPLVPGSLSMEAPAPVSEEPPVELTPVPEEPPVEPTPTPIEEYKDIPTPAEKKDRLEIPPQDEHGIITREPAPAKAKTVSRLSSLVILFMLFLTSAGTYMAINFLQGGGIEENYENLMAHLAAEPRLERQIELLRGFILQNKPGEFTAKAEERLKGIRILLEEKDFDILLSEIEELPVDDQYEKRAMDRYYQFLAKHPEGGYAEDVRRKVSDISDLVDDVDYKKLAALAQGDFGERISAYNGYLEKHPTGKYRENVTKLIADMSEAYYNYLTEQVKACDQQQEWETCIELCNGFVTTFREDSRLEKVVALKIKMQGQRDLTDLIRRAEATGSDYHAAKKIYADYLAQNPDTIHKDGIEGEIARIDEEIQGKVTWERVLAYSKNEQNDIFFRIKKLNSYIEQNPSGLHIQEAKSLMRQLEAEKASTELQRRREAAKALEQAKLQAEKDRKKRELDHRKFLEQNVISQIKQSGGRFKANGNGTVTDSKTGLTWTLLDSENELGKCLDYKAAKSYAGSLKTGGFGDWRLPTASELAGIYKNKPFFPDSGAEWYWSSESYVKGYHRIANVVTSKKETVYNPGQKSQEDCGTVRAVRP
ncbi:DUF1566 domain-containing protein [Thermodesulfobacteriota bacterium]